MKRILLATVLIAAIAFLAVPDAAPAASACGFNDEIIDTGTVHVYLKCTRPHADVDPDEEPHLP